MSNIIKYSISFLLIATVITVLVMVGLYYVSPETLPEFARPACDYSQDFGEYSECDESGKTSRTRPYSEGSNYAYCDYKETKECGDIDCEYSEWKKESPDDDGKIQGSRTLISGPQNVCKDLAMVTEFDADGCVYGEWSSATCSQDTGVSTKIRDLISGPVNVCKELIGLGECKSIELDVDKIVGNNKVSVGVIDKDNKVIWIENPKTLVVGKNTVFTNIDPVKIRIWYTDGGDIFLKDLKYNGTSILATGTHPSGGRLTDGAKAGTLYWRGDYDYTV